MQILTDRRQFLTRCLSASLALPGLRLLSSAEALAVEPFKRSGPPRLLLSLAAYSFRDYFRDTNHKRDVETAAARRIDMFRFIDFCAEQGCAGAEVTSYYFPAKVTDEHLLELKRHAFLRGVALSGTAVGNEFTLPKGERRDEQVALVKMWIDRAAIMGAPHLRIFGGSDKDISKSEAKRRCIEAVEECADYAGKKGVLLGLENHGGVVAEADDLLDIVRSVKSPWVGINLDTGNFHTPDPYGDLSKCAPYAVNVQLKVEIQKRGEKAQPADLARVLQILRDAGYQGYVALEYEAARDPWQAVPEVLKRIKALLAAT
jgi:sugar phosphate isomerase/epimerase